MLCLVTWPAWWRSSRRRFPTACGRRCAVTATRTRTGPTAAARPVEMAETARDIGHEWIALTDHSPRLTVANGLSAERLEAQLRLVDELNSELAPFRILTGIEVDILEDGSLDQREDLLEPARRGGGQRPLPAADA